MISRRHGYYLLIAALMIAGVIYGIGVIQENRRDRRIVDNIALLQPLIGIGAQDSFHEQVEKITDFVWANSLHRIDADFRVIQDHPDRQAGLIRAYATGESMEKPHLECATRSNIVERILWGRGYKTRSVATWRPDQKLSSHTFLEVWNESGGRWEITDPDHHLYWFDNVEKRRAGIEDLMRFPIERFQLCNTTEGCPAPSLMNNPTLIGKMAALFGVAVIRDHAAGTRILYQNKARFDLDRTGFCTRFDKYCRDPRILVTN